MELDDAAEDAALARRIGEKHDAEAELALCRRLFPRIRAYGLRHLTNEGSASDLAQHVVIVVLEALRARRVEDVDRLAAFVSGVCRNTVLEWKKVERRRGALIEKYGPTFGDVAETASASIDFERLSHCLEELAPRERTIVVMTYFTESAPDDIARELAMSAVNVRVARHRALGRLHACITRGEHA